MMLCLLLLLPILTTTTTPTLHAVSVVNMCECMYDRGFLNVVVN